MTDELFPSDDGLERQPCDPDLFARARARARGETYDAKRHGPFAQAIVPRPERQKQKTEMTTPDLSGIIDRFMARVEPAKVPAEARNPYMRAVR